MRFLPARREPSRQVVLPHAPFAGSLCWEEKLSSFPRSPTHFNELSGGTPPCRLPRIHPPGSPAPFKEASGGGWTLTGLSVWPRGWAQLAWLFWKRAGTCPAQGTQHQDGSEPLWQSQWQPSLLLSPAGSHEQGEIWPSRLSRTGNLFRASQRGCLLKASQHRVPLPTSRRRLQRRRLPRLPLFSEESR